MSHDEDARFPSGPWAGFWLQKELPGKHWMELNLTFADGTITGDGRDWIGKFTIRGKFDVQTGECHWSKCYPSHDLFYRGFNEGKGIWGTWEFTEPVWCSPTGGFHIWPEGMPDPTQPRLSEEADLPPADDVVEEPELEPAGASAVNPSRPRINSQ